MTENDTPEPSNDFMPWLIAIQQAQIKPKPVSDGSEYQQQRMREYRAKKKEQK